MATLTQSVDRFKPQVRSSAHVGQNPALQAKQSKILMRSDLMLWIVISVTALGLIGLALWFTFGTFIPNDLDPHQSFNTIHAQQALSIGTGNHASYLAFGNTSVTTSTTLSLIHI